MPPSSAETPSLSPSRGAQTLLECDYDVNPTYLYQAIEAKQWDHARRIFSKPLEAHKELATWVLRKERNGKLRWRLLPIHAAIIFRAPIDLLELMVQEYPSAAQYKDDQGMLPLHLAFRNESDWDVLEELVTAYPQGVMVKDRKGRTPLQCASSRTAKRASVMELFTQIAVSSERQRAVQESRTVLEARLSALQETHVKTLTNLKQEWESQFQDLRDESEQSRKALEEKTTLLEEANLVVAQKSALEIELAHKLQQLTSALNALQDARAMEEKAERQKFMQRERHLTEANEELLALVRSLLDQQAALKVQLDKQAWEAKERNEERARMMNNLQQLATVQQDDAQRLRDVWRTVLQESNERVTNQVNEVVERSRKIGEQQEESNKALEKVKANAFQQVRHAQHLVQQHTREAAKKMEEAVAAKDKAKAEAFAKLRTKTTPSPRAQQHSPSFKLAEEEKKHEVSSLSSRSGEPSQHHPPLTTVSAPGSVSTAVTAALLKRHQHRQQQQQHATKSTPQSFQMSPQTEEDKLEALRVTRGPQQRAAAYVARSQRFQSNIVGNASEPKSSPLQVVKRISANNASPKKGNNSPSASGELGSTSNPLSKSEADLLALPPVASPDA